MNDRHHKSAFWLGDYPESTADCYDLTAQFRSDTNKKKPTLSMVPTMTNIVSAALAAYRRDDVCLYSRSKAGKEDPRLIIELVDYLAARELVASDKGWKGINTGKTSAFVGLPTLASMFSGATTGLMVAPEPINLIELRDASGKVIATHARIITGKKRAVVAINKMMGSAKLTIRGEPVTGVMSHRVFNHDWNHGGRFYHCGQTTPKRFREEMLINGEPVAECDYSAMHINLAYALMGLQAPSGDLYAWDGVPRPVAKKAALWMLNGCKVHQMRIKLEDAANDASSADKTADAAMYRQWAKKYALAAQAFYEAHRPIVDLMNDERIGLKLQRQDSEVAERVLLELLARDVVCLPIHDSFIVQAKHKPLLLQIMGDAYRDVTGFEPPPIK